MVSQHALVPSVEQTLTQKEGVTEPNMIKELYELGAKSDTLDTLVGNASELIVFSAERSWLYAFWCLRAKELGGMKGVKEIARVLPISFRTANQYAWVWRLYSPLRGAYPRLSFTYFLVLYQLGVRGKKAIKVLDHADTGGLSIPQMRARIEKKDIEYCECPKCKGRHRKKGVK